MTMDTPQALGGASLLWRLAIAVSILAALGGCGGGGGDRRVGGDVGVGPGETSMVPETPTTAEVEGTLNRLLENATPPEMWSFGGAVVTCTAIGCPVPDAIHVDHVQRMHGRLDLSGFDFIERRRAVSLATKSQSSGEGHHFISHRTLGGWMDHSFFLVETTHEGMHAEFSYRTYSIGNTRATDPAVSFTGTWSGVMAGVIASFSDDAGASVRGDATVTVAYPGASREALVDVEFTGIARQDTGARIESMTWNNLALKDGTFGAGNVLHGNGGGYFGEEGGFGPSPGGTIFGQFYGPNHEEVGGLFRRGGVAGAFGANRGG